MSKKKYLAPQISIIMFEPQAILTGSNPTQSSITTEGDITNGDVDNDNYNNSVWE